MKTKTGYLILFLVAFFASKIFSESKADSLKRALKKITEDTSRWDLQNRICWEELIVGNYDSAMHYAYVVINETKKINDTNQPNSKILIALKKAEANSYCYLGGIYWSQGNYPLALKNYLTALHFFEQTDNKSG